ncbi:helix-hairpin-helix domain-containing protein [Spirosoma agri]|uniref:Helix-hairpin-helix domain-containing protein n=1 Tax=Spirosoma agri TaxID=1987381 RepID=A0A6M0IJV2_9BACT|nr:helix-hairpin-helix domain-containing protein [Spirosoma agri]NEU68137.1 helix-hairpin-helix domain-containing protein [Spirosoma agri]
MINRFQSLIRDYFGFSHRESRGFIVLLILTLLCLSIPFLYRYINSRKSADTAATSAADQRKLDSLVALMKAEEARQPAFGSTPEKDKTTAERFTEPKLFAFDPNTVSIVGWQQLGLPRWLAERIDKYRSKGGKFRKKEDLLRIYDFPPDLYEQLEPYVKLADRPSSEKFSTDRTSESVVAGKPYPSDGYKASNRPAFAERPAKPAVQPFDINTADTTQLIALKGIGSKLAGRIIKFRDALGGFVAPEQFRDIYGLDSLALEELQKFGKIQSTPRRIPINTASAEELDRHPFLTRRQAEVIVRYREQHGAYSSAESLKPIRILDAKTIEKITPYIEFWLIDAWPT